MSKCKLIHGMWSSALPWRRKNGHLHFLTSTAVELDSKIPRPNPNLSYKAPGIQEVFSSVADILEDGRGDDDRAREAA